MDNLWISSLLVGGLVGWRVVDNLWISVTVPLVGLACWRVGLAALAGVWAGEWAAVVGMAGSL